MTEQPPSQRPSERPLKIAYLCDMDPRLPWTYSGGNQRIYHAMMDHVGEVTVLNNDWDMAEPLRRLMHNLPDALNLRLRWRLHYLLAPVIAKAVERQLREGDFDAVFAVYSLHSMARVKTPPGVLRVFMSDATQSSYRQSDIGAGFGSFFKPTRLLDRWVQRQETRCLAVNDVNFWPSDWQKTLADQTYDLEDDKSVVVSWGANIEAPEESSLAFDLAMDEEIRLLLVGRDWFAKGGPLVLDVLRRLLGQGVKAHLTVIGATPPAHDLQEHVTVYPNLDKSKPEDLAVFEDALRSAHFMVQPSLESFGFAFCEASAFALPSLCLRRGGIPVWDGMNGHAFPEGSKAEDFASQILQYRDAPERYATLRGSTRACFEDRLNWAAWGAAVRQHLHNLL